MPAGGSSIREHLDTLAVVDHHVHGAFVAPVPRDRFELALNEASTVALPAWDSVWDTQLGFAIRARCAPLLDLDAHVEPDDYWARREQLGAAEVACRLTSASGTDAWLVDVGFTEGVCSPEELAAMAGGAPYEIVRLEQVAETAVAAGGSYAEAFRAELARRLADPRAVGCKTIIAYRTGFVVDWSPVEDGDADALADRWRDAGGLRLDDPRLLVFGIRCAIAAGVPLQFHVGFGDRDERLDHTNPMHLIDLLREHPDAPVALLHCYPFEREAGYLAQGFAGVHMDVGLAINYVGARSRSLIARSLELAPFRKILYSSDAYGPPELHLLGSRLWRDGTASVLEGFVANGDWSERDALRVATLIAADNARRLYRL